MRTARSLVSTFTCAVTVGLAALVLVAQSDSDLDSIRSWPPDTTSYVRNAIPADHTELESAEYQAGYQGVFETPAVVDVVVNNTDAALKTTDTFNDGEPSIAVNPLNLDEIVLTAFSGSW